MPDNIKLPPMPKPHTPPVFATAANTQSVKAGYELGGYEKTPPLFDEHQLEAYAREAVRLNAQADIRALIADDAYAMTFQSLGQYRSALLAALSAAPQPAQQPLPAPPKD